MLCVVVNCQCWSFAGRYLVKSPDFGTAAKLCIFAQSHKPSNTKMSSTTTTARGNQRQRGRGNQRGRGQRGGGQRRGSKADTPETKTSSEVQVSAINDDAEVCWICAEPVKYYSVPGCDHRTCHVCALRWRVLYKNLECTFCKVNPPSLFFLQHQQANKSVLGPTTHCHLHCIPRCRILFIHTRWYTL